MVRLLPYTPPVQDSFWCIPLTVSQADVKFMKGAPIETEGNHLTYRFRMSGHLSGY